MRSQRLNVRKGRSAGFYLVFFAIAMFAILALLALAIGLGVVASSSTKMQQTSNVAALGALRRYIEARSEPGMSTNYLYCADAARDRANEILNQNRTWGTQSALGGLKLPNESVDSSTDGGEVIPGSYFVEDPNGATAPDPCLDAGEEYPCFIPVDSGTLAPASTFPINAVRLVLSNQASNPIIAPFASFLGYDGVRLTSQATSALVQRCTAYVLDVSISSTNESHPMPYGDWLTFWSRPASDLTPPHSDWLECDPGMTTSPPSRVLCPNDSALFALTWSSITGAAFNETWSQADFLDDAGPLGRARNICGLGGASGDKGGLAYCNLAYENGNLIQINTLGRTHFVQHFLWRPSPLGPVWIDMQVTPEPLASFLLAFNAGIRLVQQQTTGADGVMVLPFTGRIRNEFPQTGLSNDLNFAVQLTNSANLGQITAYAGTSPWNATTVTGELHPNFADMGWFPVRTSNPLDDHTNIVSAIQEAINRLSNTNLCPATAQKSIVLATDGLATCSLDSLGGPNCPASGMPPSIDIYDEQVDQLIGAAPTSIRNQLINNRIALTTILRSSAVEPNFRNQLGPDGFMSISEQWANSSRDLTAAQQIFDGAETTPGTLPPACTALGSFACAYRFAGAPGFIFRDPNVVLGYLSLDSGGLACPLLDLCSDAVCDATCGTGGGCYVDDGNPSTPDPLRDCARPNGSFQRCASERVNLTVGSQAGPQAAACVQRAVGGNPYLLVR